MKATIKTAGMLALVACATLAGCKSMWWDKRDSSGTSSSMGSSAAGTQGSSYDSTASRMGTTPGATAGTMDSSAMATPGIGATGSMGSGAATPIWRGMVQTIEPMTRQEAGIGIGGSPGAAAAGGPIGTMGSPTDRVYRVTLRTDSGSMQSVVVDALPDYNVGDNVTYSNGVIRRQ